MPARKKIAKKIAKKKVRKKVARKKVVRKKVSGEVADPDSLQRQVSGILDKTSSIGIRLLDDIYEEVGKARTKLRGQLSDFLTEIEGALADVSEAVETRYWAAVKKEDKKDGKP